MGVIVALENYENFSKQNEKILKELSNRFDKIIIINVINLRINCKPVNIINEKYLPKNFICENFNTSSEFINYFKKIDFIAIQYLSKTLEYFKIHYLLKKANIKNIMIMNLGNFGNKQTIEWNYKYFFSAYRHYYEKGFYYLFRILTILNIFPKIDLLFECNIDTINAHNTGISRKIENFFPFLKIAYFRKIEKINSIFFDHYFENKDKIQEEENEVILYIDTPINHPDRILREGNIKNEIIQKYYKNLNIFLLKLSNLLNMEVIICLHPKNLLIKNYLSNFKISQEPTINMIPSSKVIAYSLSSSILNAVMYKKKIINIKSKFLGDYLNKINLKYVNSLKFLSHDIDGDFLLSKEECLSKMNESLPNYENFIKKKLNSDENNISRIKIINKIKENFF